MLVKRNDLRNIAIIAHVDHGKTTLVDQLLRQARTFRVNQQVIERVMDSNDLERERGITILAKNTSIAIPNPKTGEMVKINIVDTPGHADFGGEVERIMNMVDGVLLLVDAAEGPMPQTRFVLKKALEKGLPAIVVINKMDRKDAEPDNTLNATFDLFIELGASDIQANFPIIYANAITGQSGLTPQLDVDLRHLFTAILDYIPPPEVDPEAPLQILIANLAYDDYRGNMAIGRIFAGTVSANQPMVRIGLDGQIFPERARYLYVFDGLQKVEVESVKAGEIVAIAGLEGVGIGETLASPENPVALPPIYVEAPTVQMTFGVNTSPFAGQEAKWGTSRKLRERLFRELRNNIALRVEETENANTFMVSGRGELHLAILIETMRREGYEFQVSRPEVIYKRDENDNILEPFEEVHIEVPADNVGTVVEMLGSRRGLMKDMKNMPDQSVRLTYSVPTRGLLGFRHTFLTTTRGTGTMNSIFSGYKPFAGAISGRTTRSLIAWENGTTTTFGLKNAEERGVLFIGPGVEVYEGMVIGETMREADVTINVCKKKHLTNMRQSIRDIEVRLTTPRELSLDEAIEYLTEDELLEITPLNYRIRKRILNTEERGKFNKKGKESEFVE
ncbi:MAG: translational GTPase TypA [Chloroflexi bacterium]|nr:translational GTPase TypA [Chloroflexota bacterium]